MLNKKPKKKEKTGPERPSSFPGTNPGEREPRCPTLRNIHQRDTLPLSPFTTFSVRDVRAGCALPEPGGTAWPRQQQQQAAAPLDRKKPWEPGDSRAGGGRESGAAEGCPRARSGQPGAAPHLLRRRDDAAGLRGPRGPAAGAERRGRKALAGKSEVRKFRQRAGRCWGTMLRGRGGGC